ncbi:MAG: ABC transporter permease, partial [Longimicrobiales bacterium]
MVRYALRLMRNRLLGSPILLALTVAGVALGVASVVTVQLLNLNAIAAFEGTLEATSGGAELIVYPKGRALDPDVLAVTLGAEGVRNAVPLHQVNVRVGGSVQGAPVRHLKVLGLDLMSGVAAGSSGASGTQLTGDLGRLIATPGIAIPEGLSATLSVVVGDSITLLHGSEIVRLPVAGLLADASESAAAVLDIAWSESLFGRGPSQLNVYLADEAVTDEAAQALQARLGTGVRVTSPAQEGLEARSLLSAFRLNLTALSFISVFVGAFLVYGTTRATLVRRRGEFGVLRSLGASRAQVLGLIVCEILFLGAAGVLIGLPLGYWAAQTNMGAVSGTLTNLYLLEALETLRVPPWLWALAVLVGVGSAMIGGLLPAIETTSRRIRSLLSSVPTYGVRGPRPRQLAFAAGSSLLAALSLTFLTGWVHRGLAAAFLLVAALPLAAGWVVGATTKPLRPRRLGISYAVSSLSHRLTSAGVAVAGLAIAVTMMVGITVMVWSFRNSLSDWIDATVRADIYVSAAAWRGDRDSPGLSPQLIASLEGLEGLSEMDRVRGFSGRAAGRPVALRGVDLTLPDSLPRFHRLRSSNPSPGFNQAGLDVYVSEPFARKTGLSVGDEFDLDTPEGTVSPTIAAVLRDYGNE